MLCAEHISLRLQGRPILAPMSLRFEPGALHAIFGPNGAGKSSLLRLLAREWPCRDGGITLDGRSLGEWPAAELGRRRAMLPQQHELSFPFLAAEVVGLGRLHAQRPSAATERAIVAAALAACGASALADRCYARLSGGERARVQLARVLAQIWEAPADGGPRYLLLDEPTAHLDLAFQHACLQLAREWTQRRVCVIAVLHDPNLVLAYADHVSVLANGHLRAWGKPEEILSPALMEEVYGVHSDRLQSPSGQHWLAIRAVRARQ